MHQTSRSNRTWDLANGSNHGNNSFMHLKGTSYLTYHSFTRLLILLNVLEKDGKSWWSTPNKKDDLLTLKKEHWPQKTTREKCLETKQCLCDRINQMQHAIPAAREAQRVIAMTPLFWEKVVLGGDVIRTARMLFKPSASRPHVTQCWWIWPATKNWNHQKTVFLKCHLPDSSKKKTANISPSKPWPLENSKILPFSPPWIRLSASGPSNGKPLTSQVAWISPTVSTEVTTKPKTNGKKAGG